MGGCRCTYKTCNVKSDGKTHMFHYPVFDKVRCHKWLVNAQRFDFLDLKVSQLKNRVVCQHHFKQEFFMNYKKDKLTFEAVPTLDGPFCDPSKTGPGNIEMYPNPILLADIENDIDISDKKANFPLKYADFLTNNEFVDSSARYNRSNRDYKIDAEEINSNFTSNNKNKDKIYTKPQKMKLQSPKKHFKQTKMVVSHHSDCSNDPKMKKDLNIEKKLTNLPSILNFQDQVAKTENSCMNYFAQLDNLALQPSQNLNKELLASKDHALETNLVNIDPLTILNFQDKNSKVENMYVIPQKESNEFEQTKQRLGMKEAKIKILSEKKIEEPINIGPIIGNFEPISPSRPLSLPDKSHKPFRVEKEPEVLLNTSIAESEKKPSDKLKVLEVLNVDFEPKLQLKPSVIEKDQNNLNSNTTETIASHPSIIQIEQNNCTTENIGNISESSSPKKSAQIKNKITPERSAAIERKRKFNLKLKDIIESCLDKLDDPLKNYDISSNVIKKFEKAPDNAVEKIAKPLNTLKTMQIADTVDSHLNIDKNSPQYTIAYLVKKMKKMENNLLNKIAQNSQQIVDFKNTLTKDISLVVDKCNEKRNQKEVSTQTSENENCYKKFLYQEVSKYLSPNSNSLIYEELFINKYSCEKEKRADINSLLTPRKRKRVV